MTAAIAYPSSRQLEAALALQGAEARLAKAEAALADFLAEHGAAASHSRDYHALLIERDDAVRQLDKARLDLADLEARR